MSRDELRTERDAHAALAAAAADDSKPAACWLDDGPAEGYRLPGMGEAIMGEFWEQAPFVVMFVAMLAVVLAFAAGVIVTERLDAGDSAAPVPVPASAPASGVRTALRAMT